MRMLRLVLTFLLAMALPFHGFAAASMRAAGAHAWHGQASVARHGSHVVTPHVQATASTQPNADGSARGTRSMACCQPALLSFGALPVSTAVPPAHPAFTARPGSSWMEPVPRKPPRA